MNTLTSVRRAATGSLLALALSVSVACGSDSSDSAKDTSATSPASVTRTYVGTAQGTASLVAVVVDGTRALAYVCDGMPGDPAGAPPTVQTWFNGASDGKTVKVTQSGGQLQLRLTDTDMTGTVTLADGRTLPVTGKAVFGDAGLYRAEAAGNGGTAIAGWILAADGQQRGGVGGEGSFSKPSGTKALILTQPTFSLQGLATARIAKVGITPIPIP
jgi:hypothetical protein